MSGGCRETGGVFWTGGIRERYANERISRNEAETATAKASAEVASENAAAAHERTEKIRQANLQIQLELERERMERLKLEASIARRLTDLQRTALVAALMAAPQPLIINFMILGDQEAATYADDIGGALEAARVQGSVNRIGVLAPPRYGLLLTLQAKNQKALAIKAAFERARIPVTVSFEDTGEFDAKILVGLRPLGPHQ